MHWFSKMKREKTLKTKEIIFTKVMLLLKVCPQNAMRNKRRGVIHNACHSESESESGIHSVSMIVTPKEDIHVLQA